MKFIGALGAPQFEFCGIKRKQAKNEKGKNIKREGQRRRGERRGQGNNRAWTRACCCQVSLAGLL